VNESTGGATRVLVVDDAPANLGILEKLLRGEGYAVDVAATGEEALALALRDQPDLILLDALMTGMDGFEICRRLKADTATRDIPVIFISSLDDTASKVNAFIQGGVDYITIPFHKEEVLVRIKTHLNLRRMQQELKCINKVFDDELRWAGEMQKALLRPKLNSTSGVGFRVSYQPVPGLYCGGDYYDVITLPEDRYLILTGDVAGHGVRAAFITGILKAIIYSEYVRNYVRAYFSPAAFLSWLNERMNFELRKTSGLLISFLAGVIDRRAMTFTYANAGQNHPFIVKTTGARPLSVSGPAIGLVNAITYADINETLETGDIILAYTDGLTEFGSNRGVPNDELAAILTASLAEPDYHQYILTAVLAASDLYSFEDDVTILSAKLI